MQIVDDFSRNPQEIQQVEINETITISEFIAISDYHAHVSFSQKYKDRVTASYELLNSYIERNVPIYGVNTGLGDNVDQKVSFDEMAQLQVNTIRSHAVSVGQALPEKNVRAIELMTLINLGKGYSGISLETLDAIRKMLNADIYPFAPSDGSVGYLSIEAHIYLVLIGEGKGFNGKKLMKGSKILEKAKLTPIVLQRKEGLAIIQGTASVTAQAVLALYKAYQLIKVAEIGGSLTFESLNGNVKSLDDRAFQVKMHDEERETARKLRAMLSGSVLCETDHFKIQDALSLRTFPHVIGAVKRAYNETWQSVREEMDSCSDNPIILPSANDDGVLMNGNFDATYIGMHMDLLSIAMTNLAKLIERLTNRLLDTRLSGLPAFLVNTPGINNGLMILQYTSAGLYSECKILAQPASVDNVTTSAEQEDVVTFGYVSADKALKILQKLESMTAIWMLCNQAAIGFKKGKNLSTINRVIYMKIKSIVPLIKQDRHFYQDVCNIEQLIDDNELLDLVDIRYV